jgi:hypothetical protein
VNESLNCAFLLLAGQNKVTVAINGAHEGGIFSICIMKDGTFVTGGKDKKIIEWNNSYKRTGREHEVMRSLVEKCSYPPAYFRLRISMELFVCSRKARGQLFWLAQRKTASCKGLLI